MTTIEKIRSIEKEILRSGTATKEDYDFLKICLNSIDTQILSFAGTVITQHDRWLLELADRYKTLNIYAKQVMAPLIAGAHHHQAQRAIFKEYLITSNKRLQKIILISLTEARYMLFPLVLEGLHILSDRNKDRMIDFFHRVGLAEMKPHLALFPVIPKERFFREVFGDDAIDEIYK